MDWDRNIFLFIAGNK